MNPPAHYKNSISAFILLSVCLLCIAAASGNEMTETDIAKVRENLSQYTFTMGQFQQIRTITGIPKPLTSSGRFAIWNQHGIYWQTEAPFFSATSYTGTDIIDWNEDLTPLPNRGSLGTIQKYINEVMVALFNVDEDELNRYFALHWSGDNASWQLQLTPTMSAIKRNIYQITLNGGLQVDTVKVESAQHDITTIQFSEVSAGNQVDSNLCPRFFRLSNSACN